VVGKYRNRVPDMLTIKRRFNFLLKTRAFLEKAPKSVLPEIINSRPAKKVQSWVISTVFNAI
jgi:hypothetical protein